LPQVPDRSKIAEVGLVQLWIMWRLRTTRILVFMRPMPFGTIAVQQGGFQ
jgi:hypothetical protein